MATGDSLSNGTATGSLAPGGAYPEGVTLAELHVGPVSSFMGTSAKVIARVSTVLKGTKYIVHGATGWQLMPSTGAVTADPGQDIVFSLPHTDQEGWRDSSGREFTGWAYRVTIEARAAGKVDVYTKTFQLVAGQTGPIELATIPDGDVGEPVTAPAATVTSILGRTGAVTEDDLRAAGLGGLSDEDVALYVRDGGTATGAAIADAVDERTADRVPPLVADAIAADRTVADAAAAAVSGELDREGIFHGVEEIPEELGLAFTLTDRDGHRSWVEFGFDGRPTEHAAQVLTEALQSGMTGAVSDELGIAEVADMYGWAYVVTDRDDRVFGGFRADGTFEARKLTLPADTVAERHLAPELRGSIASAGVRPLTIAHPTGIVSLTRAGDAWELRNEDTSSGASTLLYAATSIGDVNVSDARVYFTAPEVEGGEPVPLSTALGGGAVVRVLPEWALAAYGDSMTEGMGGGYGANAWPAVTAAALGMPFLNSGKSAQTSTEIATRQGGITPTFTIAEGSIPGSGAVSLTLVEPAGSWRSGFAWEWAGRLGDVPGVLRKASDNTWTFTRSTAGNVVPAPGNVTFTSDQGRTHSHWIQTVWVGRNNTTRDVILRDVAAMVGRIRTEHKRFLVFPVFNSQAEVAGTGGYANVMGINAGLAEAYGARYIDTRRWIIDNGLTAAGLTPTAEDTAAVANDAIPPALMADSLHLNSTGYRVLGEYIATVIQEKGWA